MAAGRLRSSPAAEEERTAALKAGAGILSGLLRGADRRRDTRLRAIYTAALGDLAELNVSRLRRERLP